MGEVLRGKAGTLPDLVHTHPAESVRDVIEIINEYGVSVLPVLSQDVLAQIGDTKAIVDARNSALYVAQGAGALLAAFAVVMNNSSRVHARRLLLGEAAYISGMIGISFAHSTWATVCLVGLMGWGSVTQLTTMNTLIQLHVPNGLRGQASAIYYLANSVVGLTLGPLSVGLLTDYVYEDPLRIGDALALVAIVIAPATALLSLSTRAPFTRLTGATASATG